MKSAGLICIVSGAAIGITAISSLAIDKNTQGSDEPVRRSVQKREHTPRVDLKDADSSNASRGTGPAIFPNEFRTIDGINNNLANPLWGASSTDMMRMMGSAYPLASGEVPARMDGPSPRAVSNTVNASQGDIPNSANASDFLWQWGQFLDHDIDETPIGSPPIAMDIEVPVGDPWFDPQGNGGVVIGMNRSAFHMDTNGDRQQINEITAFIDASNVYGSDDPRAAFLRASDGTGRLITSPGDLLPFNTAGFDNAPTGMDPSFFLAGDVRANEQVGLTAMHTLFMREHNYWADQFAIQFPKADDDELYERARAVVVGEMQAITFNEFLPILLGPDTMGSYTGYNPGMEPMISNVFATAAYRVGHTMLSSTLLRVDVTDQEADGGHLPLQMAFFDPTQISNFGIDTVLRGLASQHSQQIDTYVVDDIRNFLFGAPGSGGFDLASLNIQRGRDHGLPDYNSMRDAFGLAKVDGFHQVSDDAAVNQGLFELYATVDDIDPWVGLLAEPAVPGALVGETLHMILVDQFSRLRSGDRFWYEAYLPADMVEMVNQQTLATIIRRNTGIGDELSDDVFQTSSPCPADINNDGVLNYFDISEFIARFVAQDPRVDFIGGDGGFDFFDVDAFVNLFSSGCDQ